MENQQKKAIVYIDGFNLYYGIKSLNRPEFKWLDLQKLADGFLDADTQLLKVKYFTSQIKGEENAMLRQKVYLNAVRQSDKTSLVKGHFLRKGYTCRNCNHHYYTYEEKKTDVNLACELLADAYENRFDIAFVVSGDSDLVSPISRAKYMGKKVTVAFPPKRISDDLKKTASAYFNINAKHIKQSLFPREITMPKGKKITCPEEWSKSE